MWGRGGKGEAGEAERASVGDRESHVASSWPGAASCSEHPGLASQQSTAPVTSPVPTSPPSGARLPGVPAAPSQGLASPRVRPPLPTGLHNPSLADKRTERRGGRPCPSAHLCAQIGCRHPRGEAASPSPPAARLTHTRRACQAEPSLPSFALLPSSTETGFRWRQNRSAHPRALRSAAGWARRWAESHLQAQTAERCSQPLRGSGFQEAPGARR